MMKYRKKPIVIEAIKYERDHIGRMQDFCDRLRYNPHDNEYYVDTLEGCMKVADGDFLIKGVNGEFYPCKADIFHKTYEFAAEDNRLQDVPDMIAFSETDPEGKREMIAVAINGDDLKLNYSRQCLLAMIKWQKELLAEAYDAFECSQLSQADKDVDLMRYIGLKDNYGTEICEGDIVEHFDGEYFFTGVVTYSPFGWHVKSKYDNISFEHFADESEGVANCRVIRSYVED